MKKFKYRWETKGSEFTGSRVCESREDLKRLIVLAEGKLLEILEEADAPQAAVIHEPSSAASPSAAVFSPEVPEKTNLLHSSRAKQEPDILIKIWAWFMMISGGLLAAAGLLGGLLMFFISIPSAVQGRLGGVSGIAAAVIVLLIGAVDFFMGVAALSFPVAAAYVLLAGASVRLLLVLTLVFSGKFYSLAGAVVPGLLVWYILRKKKA